MQGVLPRCTLLRTRSVLLAPPTARPVSIQNPVNSSHSIDPSPFTSTCLNSFPPSEHCGLKRRSSICKIKEPLSQKSRESRCILDMSWDTSFKDVFHKHAVQVGGPVMSYCEVLLNQTCTPKGSTGLLSPSIYLSLSYLVSFPLEAALNSVIGFRLLFT